MKTTVNRLMLVLAMLLAGVLPSLAQQPLTFRVVSFGADPFDLAASSDEHRETDGSGSLYAIIKVEGENPSDDVTPYLYDFGQLNHKVTNHNGEVWVYVQKNAKRVTISRKGYKSLSGYDLGLTIEAGKTYRLVLSAQAPVVRTQMLMFAVAPADSKAVVAIKGDSPGAVEQMLGTVDEGGAIARNLPLGTYSYRILSENYYPTEGTVRLNDYTQTYTERVTLRPRFSLITLNVAAQADIYVNGERKGTRSWTGQLNAGTYQVECRQLNHTSTTQSITVEESRPQTLTLAAPTPITGTLSVLSAPLGAAIRIDGRDYGTTPCNIPDLLIGRHTVTLSRQGYGDQQATVEVKEGQTTDLNLTLKTSQQAVVNNASSSNAAVGGQLASGAQAFTVKGVTFYMVPVEGGTFIMGGTSEQGKNAFSREKPTHPVTLSNYSIGETEVTQALWEAVMGSNPSNFKGSNKPVEQVSWDDCQTFIQKLNQLTGRKFRLPTEAEWEYAARGGKKSRGYKYSGSKNIKDVAWYDGNSKNQTHDVKTKQANELGIYDMSGNVWEWCQDWYGSYSSSAQTNPTGASSGSDRVGRGGGWYDYAWCCRSSYRFSPAPTNRDNTIGFRLAL